MIFDKDFVINIFFILIYLIFSFIYFTFIAFKALKNLENQQYDLLKDNLEKIAYFWLFSIGIIFGSFLFTKFISPLFF